MRLDPRPLFPSFVLGRSARKRRRKMSPARRRSWPLLERLHNRTCPSSLTFSTYLGGSGFDGSQGSGSDQIVVDASGNSYVVGSTWSANFPTTAGAFQQSFNDSGSDGYVAKFDANGVLVWATYLGGSGYDYCSAVAVDGSGNVYVTGTTLGDFPTTPGTLEATWPGGYETTFVAELNATGSALVYSTFVGESAGESVGRAIKVDKEGDTYVAVETTATAAPGDQTTAGAFQPTYPGGSYETYIAKLNPGGTALIYATYLGGSTYDTPSDIALDASGDLYVAGDTRSTNFPTTPGAFQASNAGGVNPGDRSTNWDTFVTKLNATGTEPIYSTYLGGSGFEQMAGLALDASGDAEVVGQTYSTDFPTANAIQPTLRGISDAFVTKLNTTGTALIYSTYLGGSGADSAYAVAVDSAGNTYVAGYTGSADFPTVNPLQAANAGGYDAFAAQLSPSGAALLVSTYLGGSGNDFCQGAAIDASGDIYLTGQISSSDFPITQGAFQQTYGGGASDAFVAKIATRSALRATGTTSSGTEGVLASFLVATFTDSDPNDGLVDLSATIAWGDGDSSVGTVLAAAGGGFAVVGPHNYAKTDDYIVNVNISDIGGSTASARSTINVVISPLSVTSISAVSPNPRKTAVSSIDVTFSRPVNLGTFTDSALSLSVNGGPSLITDAVTTAPVSGSTYQIVGLAGLTTSEGTYTLTINAAVIQDQSGNAGSGTLSTSWLVDTTPPVSHVIPLPVRETSLSFAVSATGNDPDGANGSPPSGVASYDIYTSTNGGTWSLWTNVPASNPTATFTGQSSTTHSFYSIAHDVAGNAESKTPLIEASTYLPDLTPPVTAVNGSTGPNPSTIDTATGTFTLNLSGDDPGGGLLNYFEVYVSVDGGAYQEVGPDPIPAGAADSHGNYSSTVIYQGLTDGRSHTYSFYSMGLDSAGNLQGVPTGPNVTFADEVFARPGQLQVTGFTVEHDSPSRSYVRYLDIAFNESDGQSGGELTSIVDSIGTPSPDIQIYKFDLNGDTSSKSPVSLASPTTLSVIDHAIEIDFGAGGIGGNPKTTAADGYYEVDIDPPGGQAAVHHFDRLLGDVNGDGIVDQNDLNEIAASIGDTSPMGWTPLSADVTGVGTVTAFDLTLAVRSKGRKLGSGLSLG